MRKSSREDNEIVVLQVRATFSSEDEPQESVSHSTFSSTVRPFLSTEGTAVLVREAFERLSEKAEEKRRNSCFAGRCDIF